MVEVTTLSRSISLTANVQRSVGNEQAIDEDAGRGVTVTLPAGDWAKVVALAQSRGFRVPRLHLYPAQATELAKHVREALAESARPVGARSTSRFSVAHQLADFYNAPRNRKVLNRVLALLESGRPIDVTEA
jgi:hypothetical protein